MREESLIHFNELIPLKSSFINLKLQLRVHLDFGGPAISLKNDSALGMKTSSQT